MNWEFISYLNTFQAYKCVIYRFKHYLRFFYMCSNKDNLPVKKFKNWLLNWVSSKDKFLHYKMVFLIINFF
jgi:hypothetical protein